MIVARTDEIYLATEDMLDIFKRVVEALADTLQAVGSIELRFGDLKDPVRIHEKGICDYSSDFDDFADDTVIPEACVIDVLRGRAVCSSGALMLLLQQELLRGFEVTLDGRTARLELLRAKSKFAEVDPTHFRNILNNLSLTFGDRKAFAELQVQQTDVLAYNDQAHAHDHYNYFRSLLADKYASDLDAMLERVLLFLDEVAGVPVLLSMLVLIFEDGSTQADSLPTSRFELYEYATQHVLRRRCPEQASEALVMLKAIARANLEDSARREFSTSDVREAASEHVDLWHQLDEGEKGVPLVKTLATPVDGAPGQYQFRHLSLQEGLCAQMIMADLDGALASSEKIKDIWRKAPNVTHIGGAQLGARLRLTELDLGECNLDDAAAPFLVGALSSSGALTKLE